MNADNITIIVTALLIISEALASIPQIKANSIFQIIVNVLQALTGKKEAVK